MNSPFTLKCGDLVYITHINDYIIKNFSRKFKEILTEFHNLDKVIKEYSRIQNMRIWTNLEIQ